MLKRFLLSAFLALLPSLAFAQATLLQGGNWQSGHPPMYSGSGGSQPIVVDSGPASGGAVGLGLSEILQVNRSGNGDTTAPYASNGTGPLGTHNCFYDAPTTNSTGYHYLCLDSNAQGGGLIAYNAVGASQLPFNFSINGTIYDLSGGLVTSITAGTGISVTGSNPSPTVSLAAIGSNLLLANTAVGSAVPIPTSLSALFDSGFGSAQGDTLWRGPSGWTALGPGADGSCLTFQTSGPSVVWGSCSGMPSSGTVTSVTLATPASTLSLGGTNPITGSGTINADLNLSHANTWLSPQTFTNSDIRLLGSSTGYTTFTSANSTASNFVLTFPAATDTLVTLAATQTLTNKSISGSEINSDIVGSTYGGSGVSNPTAHAVLLGEGSSAFGTATIGTAGRMLLDQGSGADPAFTAMSGDASINSSGALTLGTVNSNVGTFTYSTITANAKGQITSVSSGTPPGLSSKIITFTRANNASSGSVSYTGVGFKPTSISIVGSSSVGGTTTGFVDSSKSGASTYIAGGDSTSVANAIYLVDSDGGQVADVASYDNDGLTLIWTESGGPLPGTLTFYVICYK